MEQQQQRQRFHKACGWLKTAVRSSNAKKWQQLLYGDTASRVYEPRQVVDTSEFIRDIFGDACVNECIHDEGEKHRLPRV